MCLEKQAVSASAINQPWVLPASLDLIDRHCDRTKLNTETVDLVHVSVKWNLLLRSLWNWGSGSSDAWRQSRKHQNGNTRSCRPSRLIVHITGWHRCHTSGDFHQTSAAPPPHLHPYHPFPLLLLNEALRWLLVRVRESWGRISGVGELFAFPDAEASPDRGFEI